MKNTKLGVIVSLMSLTALAGCSHGAIDRRIDEKLGQESTVKSKTDLRAEAGRVLDSAPGLTDNQRTELRKLRDSIRAQEDSISGQSLRLRALLVKDVVSPDYDAAEVDRVKARLKSLENQRLSVLFDAVDQANRILGRQAVANQKLVRGFLEYRGGNQD